MPVSFAIWLSSVELPRPSAASRFCSDIVTGVAGQLRHLAV
ncbi:MAG: hypothetical protein ACI8TP_003388, partial [Acidimicrobiales bacterium]